MVTIQRGISPRSSLSTPSYRPKTKGSIHPHRNVCTTRSSGESNLGTIQCPSWVERFFWGDGRGPQLGGEWLARLLNKLQTTEMYATRGLHLNLCWPHLGQVEVLGQGTSYISTLKCIFERKVGPSLGGKGSHHHPALATSYLRGLVRLPLN